MICVSSTDAVAECFNGHHKPSLKAILHFFFLRYQVEILQEKLEMVPVQYSGFAKKRREKNLKRELQALRRQMKQERKISGELSVNRMGAWTASHNIEKLELGTQLTHTHSLIHTHTHTHTESDEHGTPPPRRQRAASIPRNAEELACHVLHGSLRLTPSRQQILSHSGIRLEERAASQQQEGGQQQQTNTQVNSISAMEHKKLYLTNTQSVPLLL